ncbi:MAG: ribosomal protein S5-alanine N-acetyltransferase [Pseudomonadota bacterium]
MFRPRSLPELRTNRLCIKLLDPQRADIMVKFRLENRDYLKPWEPRRTPEFFTEPFWQLQLRYSMNEFREGHSVCLVLLNLAEEEVLGVCNYTNIVRGTFQACHLGYALAERHQGKGLMFEALEASNRYIFEEMGLNRIMANYLPHNERSGRLLARLGFRIEGKAEKFLKIDGRWEDHVLTSRLNPAARYD